MNKKFTLRYTLFSVFLDLVSVVAALYISTYLRAMLSASSRTQEFINFLRPAVYPVAVLLWVIAAFSCSLYDSKKVLRWVDEFQTLTITEGLFWLSTAGMLFFLFRTTSRLVVVYATISCSILTISWRILVRAYYRIRNQSGSNGNGVHRVLIVGAGQVGQRAVENLQEYAWTGLEVVGYLDDNPNKDLSGESGNSNISVLGTLDNVHTIVGQNSVDEIIIALPARAHKRLRQVVSLLVTMPVDVRIIPDYFDLSLYQATIDNFHGMPIINLRDTALTEYQRLVKRLFDIAVGSLLLAFSLPLMGLIAIAIKLDSPGPVFFYQDRVGENGRLFKFIKFRSMVSNAEKLQAEMNEIDGKGNVIHKHKDDPRVTRVGHFLRRWSLDELPQFINVLKGDMSLVGPRPELPWLVDKYEPWQRKRFAVPQGITGWWQVSGRSDKVMHLHTDEDLYYIQHYSLWLDILIMLKTPWVMLRGKGAF
jgi:exopolysaccharide biosynthesis polyprenyl glycosylphosphotransferase